MVFTRLNSNVLLVIVLSIVSISTYIAQYLLFHKPNDQSFNILQDLAFLPVQVIVVTIIFNKLLGMLEKRTKDKNMNVLISAFFSDVGNSILYAMTDNRISEDQFAQMLDRAHFKDNRSFKAMTQQIREHKYRIDVTPEKLEALKYLLLQNRPVFLDMLDNSHLAEHDTFTDMLWALFHVADELAHQDMREPNRADLAHLRRDIQRAYPLLLLEWVQNLKYLHDEYPYMFDAAIRFSPITNSTRLLPVEEPGAG